MLSQNSQSFLQGLNSEQLSAVKEKQGAILVLAGAGSGKTKVLTSRIAYLVSKGINPCNILAVTFTNKASKEMRSRLSNYLGENVVKRMWVGTFHNICGRILRYELENYKTKDSRSWNNNYVIYDDTDTKTVIKNALKKFNLDEKIYDYKVIKSIISNAKNKMQDAHGYATYAKDYYSQKVSEIYYEYEKQLALNNAIDFDDMLMLSVNILKENEQIRDKYRKRFSHILIDEFQDTNKAQYDLIKILYPNDCDKEGSLCAVGDVDQSIYSWRGADFKIILNFQGDYKNSKLIKLEQNYRSTGNILNAANEVIKNNEQRLEKNLYSNKGQGEKITVFEAKDDFSESRYIAKKIENLNRRKEDIAILYRTNAQSRSIEEALISYSIPYKIVGGLKFYERKEIKDIISYLKLIYNPNDSQALKRIINEPKRGIGDGTLKKLSSYCDSEDLSLYQALRELDKIEDINERTKKLLENFRCLIEELILKQKDFPLSEYVSYILEKTGYLASLRAEDNIENQSRLENLQEFINVVKEFETDDFNLEEGEETGLLGNFLNQVALVSDTDELKEQDSCVTLMTLHSAKGLEYPVIFLAGLEDGLFPHTKTLGTQNNINELEEERRLMYVGITRAKEKLFLTYANQRKVWGNYQSNPKSRFLNEIPSEYIEEETFKDTSHKTSSSFSSTISKIKEKKSASSASQTAPSTNNFASSLARIKQNAQKAKEKQIQKPQIKEEKPKTEFKNANLSVSEMIALAKQKAKQKIISTARQEGLYPIGTKVFHKSFGIGNIIEIQKEHNQTNYIIDFLKHGKKTLDTASSSLETL